MKTKIIQTPIKTVEHRELLDEIKETTGIKTDSGAILHMIETYKDKIDVIEYFKKDINKLKDSKIDLEYEIKEIKTCFHRFTKLVEI